MEECKQSTDRERDTHTHNIINKIDNECFLKLLVNLSKKIKEERKS